MRKTLLIAAAALAAGVISSQAQNVYSQNIVGYVNVASTNVNGNYFLATPFSIGVSNGANEIYGTNLPSHTSIEVWNGHGFTVTIWDTSDPLFMGDTGDWYDANEDAVVGPPVLPPGMAYVLVPSSGYTNLYAGTVAVNVGTTNNQSFTNVNGNYFVGVAVPYGGAVTNGYLTTNTTTGLKYVTGGANLNNLPSHTSVEVWNGSGFTVTIWDTSDPLFMGDTGDWYDANEDAVVPPPQIQPGQGFVIVPSGSYTWTTGL
jgi:hypothetical protein